jgi:cell division septation protein DedD
MVRRRAGAVSSYTARCFGSTRRAGRTLMLRPPEPKVTGSTPVGHTSTTPCRRAVSARPPPEVRQQPRRPFAGITGSSLVAPTLPTPTPARRPHRAPQVQSHPHTQVPRPDRPALRLLPRRQALHGSGPREADERYRGWVEELRRKSAPKPSPRAERVEKTVAEVLVAYYRFAMAEYAHNKSTRHRIHEALQAVKEPSLELAATTHSISPSPRHAPPTDTTRDSDNRHSPTPHSNTFACKSPEPRGFPSVDAIAPPLPCRPCEEHTDSRPSPGASSGSSRACTLSLREPASHDQCPPNN